MPLPIALLVLHVLPGTNVQYHLNNSHARMAFTQAPDPRHVHNVPPDIIVRQLVHRP